MVTPVDLRRQDVKLRRDIVEKKLEEIKQEAPYAYKGIGPIIQTLTAAGHRPPGRGTDPADDDQGVGRWV